MNFSPAVLLLVLSNVHTSFNLKTTFKGGYIGGKKYCIRRFNNFLPTYVIKQIFTELEYDPALTTETIDKQGWLHTGDVGRWLPDGNLQIIDRKNQIFKIAQGDYIALAKIESIYQYCKCVSEVFVDGRPMGHYTVAVVVPEVDVARKWTEERRLRCGMVDLCQDDGFIAYVLEQMHQVGKDHGLKSIEQVKYISLCPNSFAFIDGLLTPTLKVRRRQMRQHFSTVLEELYARG
ncbi:unnamed protein product [Soboliphyme baturini]|uniref:AMP-binding domain-containing protein n=1 Tax=Soboliphyme baturini TaxID=241478 RepID=A0A183J1L6_9BILA|nr:unnamed protein product [Soboliphyme baturini]